MVEFEQDEIWKIGKNTWYGSPCLDSMVRQKFTSIIQDFTIFKFCLSAINLIQRSKVILMVTCVYSDMQGVSLIDLFLTGLRSNKAKAKRLSFGGPCSSPAKLEKNLSPVFENKQSLPEFESIMEKEEAEKDHELAQRLRRQSLDGTIPVSLSALQVFYNRFVSLYFGLKTKVQQSLCPSCLLGAERNSFDIVSRVKCAIFLLIFCWYKLYQTVIQGESSLIFHWMSSHPL